MQLLRAIPELDGSFLDSHEIGRSYGTAMALLTIANAVHAGVRVDGAAMPGGAGPGTSKPGASGSGASGSGAAGSGSGSSATGR